MKNRSVVRLYVIAVVSGVLAALLSIVAPMAIAAAGHLLNGNNTVATQLAVTGE